MVSRKIPHQSLESHLFAEKNMEDVSSLPRAKQAIVVFSAAYSGKERVNEDTAWVGFLEDGSIILAVADGVGGARRGQDAARVAMTSLQKVLEKVGRRKVDLRSEILNGFEKANKAILDLRIGAATTFMVVTIHRREIQAYHAGDSGCLVVGRGGKCKLKNIYHTPFAFAEEAGIMSEEERRSHEDSHVVTNVLGDTEMRIEIGPRVKLAATDRVVVGTDGLFDNLSDEEITEIIRKGPLDESARQLIKACKKRMEGNSSELFGKPDDLTFILFGR